MATRRATFTAKLVGAGLLVAVADVSLFGRWTLPAPGLFALGWTIVLLAAPHGRRCWVAGGAALLFAGVLIEDPSLLGWTMFWVAVSLTALLPHHRFDDASRWAQRLAMHALRGLGAPFRDLVLLSRHRRRPAARGRGITAVGRVVALPLIGSSLFLALFAGANPLIGEAFAMLRLPDTFVAFLHVVLWIGVVLAVWPSLRPSAVALRFGADLPVGAHLPHLPLGTLTLSLVCFNAVFALPNALDLIFLWSGAPLPGSVTLADYAHRGAYTLIATALLAGLFVLVALRPGSMGAANRLVRRLLVLWVAQNLLLVASGVLRLVDYIAAYSLTEWRIAALAWMALVGVGLVLICWRLLANRSVSWLINANALAATLVLTAGSVVDLGATAAAWNVRHARDIDDLDLCYLNGLGASALLPLIDLERRVSGDSLHARIAYLRTEAMRDALWRQDNPWMVSWRNTRRLDAAVGALGPNPARVPKAAYGRSCDGRVLPDPAPVLVAAPASPPVPIVATPSTALTAEGER